MQRNAVVKGQEEARGWKQMGRQDIDVERPSETKRREEVDRAILTRQPFALVTRYLEL